MRDLSSCRYRFLGSVPAKALYHNILDASIFPYSGNKIHSPYDLLSEMMYMIAFCWGTPKLHLHQLGCIVSYGVNLRKAHLLQFLCIWCWHFGSRYPDAWCVEVVESVLHCQREDLSGYAE